MEKALREVAEDWPFETEAFVLLPDHLHAMWTLPENDDRYSIRWKLIKEKFTRFHLKAGGRELERSRSRIERGERGIWQRRFWEHTIHDEQDFEDHFHYIHFNPKKHGLVDSVADWPYSTFHRYVEKEWYAKNWGGTEPDFGSNTEWGENI